MSAEAEKVISLSLCKMAESRTTRRGGTSLHKHLLIASVLTKATRARSAFLDTWYMGDDGSDEAVDLNMSYQEAEFPTDELDSAVGKSVELNIAGQTSGLERVSEDIPDSSRHVNHQRPATDAESEIDLPPDILSCVEKLNDLNDRIFSPPTQHTASSISENTSSEPLKPSGTTPDTNFLLPDVISSPHPQPVISQHDSAIAANIQEDSRVYLDLDAGSPTIATVSGAPVITSTPCTTKRRREWCFDDDDVEDEAICNNSGLYIETPVKSQSTVTNASSFSKRCKRLRFDDSGLSSPEKTIEDETGVPSTRAANEDSFKAGSFRLTYEDVDADDSDDDSFLEDALSQGLPSSSQIQTVKTRHRNDRRVPSASSSGSCSDEDDSSMEVDQLTNLVQYISFNKQSQGQNPASLLSISCVN